MIYIFVLLALVMLFLLLGRFSNSSADAPDLPRWEAPHKSDEKFSYRESYLHRNDAKHERHRRNQWPL